MEARYFLPPDAVLSVEDGAEVHAGDVLARIPVEGTKTRDITGGLPRVAELLEARRPKDHAVIAEIDGRVEFGTDSKAKRRLVLMPAAEGVDPVEHLIPKSTQIVGKEGDIVRRGNHGRDGYPAT